LVRIIRKPAGISPWIETVLNIPLPRIWREGIKGRGQKAWPLKACPLTSILSHKGRGIIINEKSFSITGII
jgi:hypothetical protein